MDVGVLVRSNRTVAAQPPTDASDYRGLGLDERSEARLAAFFTGRLRGFSHTTSSLVATGSVEVERSNFGDSPCSSDHPCNAATTAAVSPARNCRSSHDAADAGSAWSAGRALCASR